MLRVAVTVLVTGVMLALGYVVFTLARSDLATSLELAGVTQTASVAPTARPAVKPEKAAPAAESGSRDAAPSAGGRDAVLKLEVARIDAGGVSVLAGRAPPGQTVSIIANGREVASAVASEAGQWSAIVTRGFAVGPLELHLVARPAAKGPETRSAVVRLLVPEGDGRADLATAERLPAARTHAVATAAGGPTLPAMARLEAMVAGARAAGLQPAGAQPSGAAHSAVAAAAEAPVPVPIVFVTGEAIMTASGTKAASLLAEYLRLTRPEAILLSGHADARGPDSYNFELSKRRLEAIERYLRGEGYQGRLALSPKGEREPFRGIDRTRMPRDAVYQADRRVELRIGN